MNDAPTTCPSCSYNLPHHGPRCPHAIPLTFLCEDHAPARPSDNDDNLNLAPCATCGTRTRKAFRLPR